ncbi:GPW/gp25 family protein [Lysobacter arvi]|uniref:GPW/gp25 family protein n=1 Tax=Lysobacter arvi TaxID=3038776 RepID=A0ABU1CB70_9GAMM|nr:GPW/gp25 family protein [Lysobacter arvi]MDR0182412.1 GPW/gp25 family protein [Lysobacter arvi]
MIGMSAACGRPLAGSKHLAQSIATILTTPMGSRVMRRDFGSVLPELIDQPFNGATRVRMYAAVAVALMRWEPRLRLTRIQLHPGSAPGRFELELDGLRADMPSPNRRERLLVPLTFRAP